MNRRGDLWVRGVARESVRSTGVGSILEAEIEFESDNHRNAAEAIDEIAFEFE
jgi:hypothetical protein